MFFDTHCHLNFAELRDNLDDVMSLSEKHGVSKIMVPSVDRSSWAEVMSLSDQFENVYPAYGLHPLFIEKHSAEDISALKELLSKNHALAIGEIGLDKSAPHYERQKKLFHLQLEIAELLHLPVILHCRRAHEDMLAALDTYNLVGGVLHAFSGAYELLCRYVDLGLSIGVGCVVTRGNARKVHDAVRRAPLSALVLETDSPDMYVANKSRRDLSQPADVATVYQALKVLRPESDQVLKEALFSNSLNLFKVAA